MTVRVLRAVLLATCLSAGSAAAQPAPKPVHRATAMPAAPVPHAPTPHMAAPTTAAHRPAKSRPAPAQTHPAPPPAAAPEPPPAIDTSKGSVTHLPLPRFAALKTDEVNLRSGPGLRYPIEWVYKRRDLPVEIEREFEVWRRISDPEGVKGWVHQATLAGRRTLVVTGPERMLRAGPQDDASPVARLKAGVIGRLRACEANASWCEVQIGDYRGWLKRDAFWGSYAGEAIQ